MPKVCLMCGESFPDATTFCPRDGSALRAAVHGDDLIGELIAERYLITDLLSEGGMGSVYLASDVRLPQKFAVKVLRQQKTDDQAMIARFRQEAEAVCRINHDRVARVFDFGFMADGRAYIIMEYVAGRTLKDVLDTRGALPPVEAARIIHMAAEGIDAAHRLGIVHRDLKPENVMLLDDGDGLIRVKVLDFGIAKLQGSENSTGYTQPGFVIGTPAWMSPEQLMGTPLDARSDIYALALLAFTLMTAQHAFSGESDQAEMMARLSVAPTRLSDAMPSAKWATALQLLFDRALARDPSQRPATALQFANALRESVGESASESVGASVSESASESVSAPVGMAVAPDRSTISTSNRELPAAAPAVARRSKLPLVAGGVGVLAVLVVAAVLLTRDRSAPGTSATEASAPPPGAHVADTNARGNDAGSAGTVAGNIQAPKDSSSPTSAAPAQDTSRVAVDRPTTTAAVTGSSTSLPPRKNANAASTPTTPVPDASAASKELHRVMDDFDRDNSQPGARTALAKLSALKGPLSPSDRAWVQIYSGLAHLALGEKSLACAAFENAGAIPDISELVKKDSEEKRMMTGCRP